MTDRKKYLRPGFVLTKLINPVLITFNIIPILTVKGRKSGKWIKIPVSPVEFKNATYLVAPRGETQWVRNLRNDNNGKLTIKGKTQNFTAAEVTDPLRTAVVTSYKEKVPAAKSQFQSLPDPKDHPAFKLTFTN